MRIDMTLNGVARVMDVEEHHTLLDALRDDVGLTGTKECCLVGECGACTIRLNGRIVDSCLVLAAEADGGELITVEGLAPEPGRLSRLQSAFLEKGAVQCGFCIPGQLMAGDEILREHAHPTRAQVEEGIAGNLCRCGCYYQIVEAIEAAAEGRAGEQAPAAASEAVRDMPAHVVDQ
jgi:aerobic-type carbon monoxide dehydrogenase small subunit (CoxS/CutS family)